ncbi:MAG: transglutaminaseTgpA domain-containing protein [Longimicrobiales bacterium]
MNLRLLHRRLAVLMGLAGLVGFAGGAGFEPVSAVLAGTALLAALWWHPDPALSARLERVWLPLAAVLVARALFHVFVVRDDIVIPVVDLLLLLLAAEALRSLDAPNDIRLYALSFALVLASTAYRPGVLFLVAFIAYIMLATLALMIGLVRRKAERHGVREVPLGRGLVLTTGMLSGVILLIAMAVFVTFPRVSQGWAGRGEVLATSIAGFSDEISIGEHGSTIAGNPEIVLRVEFPSGVPDDVGGLRWRGRSYDRFDGVRWTRTGGMPPSGGPTQWYEERWGPGVIEQRIYGSPLDVRVLFALHPALGFDAENGVQPLFDNAGDYIYWGSVAPVYTAMSAASQPAPEELREARRGYAPNDRYFLQIPRLDPRIVALADSITDGLDNRYDRAKAIEDYLRTFEYTRDLPRTAAETSLEHFLFERRAGHCEYFSTAMVMLLRSQGIQARNVNGFLGGQWSPFGEYLVVTQNEAHSWVEVWFPGFGWVAFDPTPPGAAGTAVAASWFWPGRIWFDGLQHRWNKWVLDYSMESQVGIFANLFADEPVEAVDGASPSARVGRNGWAMAALVLVLLAGYTWARHGPTPRSPTTTMYLQLRSACARSGLVVAPGLTPLALAQHVRRERSLAGPPAERVVDLYLRARYGGESLGESDLREMREALRATRRLLKGT